MSGEVIRKNYSMISGTVRCRSCNVDFQLRRKGQNLIDHSATCNEACVREYKKLTNGIAAMIIIDLKPLSLVDDAAFKSFIYSVDHDYNIPSQAEFSDKIIPEMHGDLVQRLQNNINKEIRSGKMTAAFAIDTWTSVDSFASVAVHYITEDFKVYSCMLAVELLPKDYTHVSIHNVLLNTLETWKFNKRLPSVFCTTNKTSNINKCPDITTTWTPIPCFSACLQSAVISVLNSNQRTAPAAGRSYRKLIKKCMRIIRHFSQSVSARMMLMEKCSDHNIEPVELIEKVDTTCWISMCAMFKCLIQLRKPLTDTLLDKIKNLDEAEWAFMEDVANVLELIKKTTEIMYAEEYPMLSLYYPTYRKLEDELANFNQKTGIRQNIYRALKKEFRGSISIDALNHATLLDPRFKDKPFTKNSARSAKNSLRQKITSLCEMKPKRETEFKKSIDQEWNEYWSKPTIPWESNIINWWSAHSERFPILASAAKHFLVIPAIRVSGKRFLASKSIIENNQTKLSLETMQKLCFLHANHELEKRIDS